MLKAIVEKEDVGRQVLQKERGGLKAVGPDADGGGSRMQEDLRFVTR